MDGYGKKRQIWWAIHILTSNDLKNVQFIEQGIVSFLLLHKGSLKPKIGKLKWMGYPAWNAMACISGVILAWWAATTAYLDKYDVNMREFWIPVPGRSEEVIESTQRGKKFWNVPEFDIKLHIHSCSLSSGPEWYAQTYKAKREVTGPHK